jgi:GTP-binding protein
MPAGPEPTSPGPADELDLEGGRRLFAQECRFVWGATEEEKLPPDGLPEVAFAGRSNVGKSSLVNALTGRKTLANVSRTPGRTQQLNFFDLGGRLLLVDLPGYGYAKVAKAKVAAWSALIQRYLRGRPNLARVLVLIDARHGLKDVDFETLEGLDEAAQSYQVVLTKTDLVKPAALAGLHASVAEAMARYRAAHPEVVLTSAETGAGIERLRALLATLALPAPRR